MTTRDRLATVSCHLDAAVDHLLKLDRDSLSDNLKEIVTKVFEAVECLALAIEVEVAKIDGVWPSRVETIDGSVVHFRQEDNQWSAICCETGVAACGDTFDEVKVAIQDLMRLYQTTKQEFEDSERKEDTND